VSGCVLVLLLGSCSADCLRDSDCDSALVCLGGQCVRGASSSGLDGGTSSPPASSGGSTGDGAGGTAGEGGSSGAAAAGGSSGAGGSANAGSGGTTPTGTVNVPDAGSDSSVPVDAQ
jgi:hypothetical protein